jgi:hypothetical protein
MTGLLIVNKKEKVRMDFIDPSDRPGIAVIFERI